MSTPGLKPTVQLKTVEGRTQLFDSTARRALTLSELEAKLLALWDGLASATHLTDIARAKGLVIEARQASVLLERLGRAGFLAVAPPAETGLVPDVPGLERLADGVPKLRADLVIERPSGAKGVMHVTDPLKNRSFTLYDFEVNIARLLDGKRTAGEVIEAAEKIGIPVTLESLQKFVKQLRGYRFVDERSGNPPEPAPTENSTWPARMTWAPEIREMYQSALRLARQGKGDEALSYLNALLEIDPNLEEPRELKQRIEAEQAGELAFDVSFDSLHGVAEPPAPAPTKPAKPAKPAPPPPMVEVPWSTPSGMMDHEEDPFLLFDAGAKPTGAPPASAPVAGAPPPEVDPVDSSPSVVASFERYAHETGGAPPAPVPQPEVIEFGPTPLPVPTTETEMLPEDLALPSAPVPASPAPPAAEPLPAAMPEMLPDDVAMSAEPEALALAPSRGRRVALIILGLLLLGGVGAGVWLTRPVPRHLSVPCQLEPAELVNVTAPSDATVASFAVADGAEVKAQDPIAHWDTASLEAQVTTLQKRLDALTTQRGAIPAADPKKLKLATTAFEKAKKALDAIVVRRQKVQALPPAKQRFVLPKLQKSEAAAQTKVNKTQATLDTLQRTAERKQLSDDIAQVETLLADAKTQAASQAPLVAPQAGRVKLVAQPKTALKAGDVVVTMTTGTFRVKAQGTFDAPAGAPVQAFVVVGEQALPVRKLQFTEGGIEGLVDLKGQPPPNATLELDAGEGHVYDRFLSPQ